MPAQKLLPATKARRCPVCDGDHKCSRSADGLILCGRTTGPVPGFRHLGPAKDSTWHLFRADDAPAPARRPSAPQPPASKPVPPKPAQPLTESAPPPPASAPWVDPHPALLEHLKLPATFPVRVGVEPHPHGGWLFDEVNGDGQTVGKLHRLPDGQKRMTAGSQRGIYLPGGVMDEAGPLYVVEGASDTIALTGLGLSAVGRPSATGGHAHLIRLLAGLRPERPVTVVGENDRAVDGKWPGWDGAEATARALADALPNPVGYTFPMPAFKDVREWVSRLTYKNDSPGNNAVGFAKAALARYLDGGVRRVEPKKKREKTFVSSDGWPLALPASKLVELADRPTRWVWEGFLARGCVTLLSALPKCGKTTLLGGLLAGLDKGGAFAGKPLAVGRAVVVSEEDGGLWGERAKQLGIGENVRFCCRPFAGRLSPEQWDAFCRHAADAYADADLVVFDTLANLWPVRDENSATEVGNALLPLAALADNRAVLLVHHLRKSDGAEGTAARGSGALAAGVDVMLELRRLKGTPAGDRRRAITGLGRPPGVPCEWVVERRDDGSYAGHDPDADGGRAERTERREKKAEERAAELRDAVKAILAETKRPMTRKELWDALPEALRVNEVRFRELLETEVGESWSREAKPGHGGGFVYVAS